MDLFQVLLIIIPSMIAYAAPLIFTALGGVFSERSGVINIGLEGLMVIGAFTGIVFNLMYADVLGNWTPWISMLVAMLAAMLFSFVLAVATVSFRADQTVSGVALNLLAVGLTVFLVKKIYDKGQTDFISETFARIDVPFFSDIPFIGPIFFSNSYYIAYISMGMAIVAWFFLFKTPFGLRLRAVGEHPMAADTMGVNVTKIRYTAVLISGALAGIGGAIHATIFANDFSHTTINGQGFMAIAAMIFGKWHPIGALGAALFFGLAQSLSIVGSSLPFFKDIPSVFLLVAPYLLTIIALTGFIGRADAPKASGQPYVKGKH